MRLRTSNLTQTHAARIYKTDGVQTLTAATPVQVTLNAFDPQIGTNVSRDTANSLRAVVAGIYAITAEVRFNSGTSGEREATIRINGTATRDATMTTGSTLRMNIGVAAIQLQANDLVSLWATSTNASGVVGFAGTDTDLNMVYLGSA